VNERRGSDGGRSPDDAGRDCALADDFLPMSFSFYRARAFQLKSRKSP
jgi:hypothetical protein